MKNGVRITQLIAPAFLPVYRAIRRGEYRQYWLRGGRGSTKSSFAATALVLGLLRDPSAHAIVYRKVAGTLRESVYAEIRKVILRMGLGEWFAFQLSPLEIRYRPTGQRILFRGADDPAKSKSIALPWGYFGYLWFEELAEFAGMADLRTISASVIRGGGAPTVTLATYNPPESAACWVNEAALQNIPGRLVHQSCYLDVPPDWLGPDFLRMAEALKAEDARAYRHMYLGEVTGTGGNVFTRLCIRPIEQREVDAFDAVYAGLDFGYFPDPAVFVRCCYHPGQRRLWIYDEFSAARASNRELFDALVMERDLTAGEEVIADAAEIKSINDLRAYGMNCVAAMKGPGSRRQSMRWLQGLKEIIIDPARCPRAAREFSAYEYARTRDGQFTGTYPDGNDHAIDAVRYALNRVWMQAGG